MDPVGIFGLVSQLIVGSEGLRQALRTAKDSSTVDNELLRTLEKQTRIIEEVASLTRQLKEDDMPQGFRESISECSDLIQTLVNRRVQQQSSARARIKYTFATDLGKLNASLEELRSKCDEVLRRAQVHLFDARTRDMHHVLLGLEARTAHMEDLLRGVCHHFESGNNNTFSDERSPQSEWNFTDPYEPSLVGRGSIVDMTNAATVQPGQVVENDSTMILGTITVVHEEAPRYVPFRAKYDSGSEENFVSLAFVQEHGLTSLLQEVPEGERDNFTFIVLNEIEVQARHTLILHLCPSNMRRMRKTLFHVVDEVPHDLLIGEPFITANNVWDRARPVLHLIRKYGRSKKAKEPAKQAEYEEKALAADRQRREQDRLLRNQAYEDSKTSFSSASSIRSGISGPSIFTRTSFVADRGAFRAARTASRASSGLVNTTMSDVDSISAAPDESAKIGVSLSTGDPRDSTNPTASPVGYSDGSVTRVQSTSGSKAGDV